MKIIAIIGSPGTGKSTLMKELIKELGVGPQVHEAGLVKYHQKDNLYVIGKYETDDVFVGTDLLSMAVQPVAINWLKGLPENACVIFEGDRLSTSSFLMECAEYDLSIYLLKVSEETRQQRYKDRGSNQSEKFLKGRETKYATIQTNFLLMPLISTMINETKIDLDANVETIMKQIPCPIL